MGAYNRILKVAQEPVDEAGYELEISNPRHLDAIKSELAVATNLINSLPRGGDILFQYSGLPALLDGETDRYMHFKKILIGFCVTVLNTDTALATAIKENIDTFCSGKSVEELKNFVSDYSTQEFLIDWARLKSYGLTDEQIQELMDMQAVFNTIKNLSREEAIAFLDELLNSKEFPQDSNFAKFLKSLKKELLGDDAVDFSIDKIGSIVEDNIQKLVGVFLPQITKEALEALRENLLQAGARHAAIASGYIGNTNASHSRTQRFFNSRKALNAATDELDDALLKLHLAKFLVGGAIFIITMIKAGYDAHSAGRTGKDLLEEVQLAAINFGVGATVSGILSAVAAKITIVTIPGGYIIIGAIIAMALYGAYIEPHVEKALEEGQDTHEQRQWQKDAGDKIWGDNRVDNWDFWWNTKRREVGSNEEEAETNA